MRTADLSRRGALAGLMAVAACTPVPASTAADNAPTPPKLGPDRTAYMSIEAPIANGSRDLFISGVNRLLALNPAHIEVLMASPGGAINAAQDIVAFMDSTHAARGVDFITYNVGLVASAACYVFLAGQRRLSVPRGGFLFHEASLVANGALTSQALQEANVRMQGIESTFLAMLTSKTRLTAPEASSFIHRTVILNANEARRDGVIDAIADLALPPQTTVLRIRSKPATPTAPAPPRPAGGN